MSSPMTPKTQSVCKRVTTKGGLSGGYEAPCGLPEAHSYHRPYPDGSFCYPRHKFEPVAEPASTGEPTLAELIDQYWGPPLKSFEAARPSEPSANFMQKIGGTCLKHGEYNGQQCPKWPDCISAAAPQPGIYVSETKPHKVDDARIAEIFNREPVSGDAPQRKANWLTETLNDVGARQARIKAAEADDYMCYSPKSPGDAPKVEEIARKLHLYHCQERRSGSICPCHVIAEGMSEGCHCKEETADIASILRPYFPPASQTCLKHTNVPAAWCHDCLAIAAEAGKQFIATPASTARTDEPTKPLCTRCNEVFGSLRHDRMWPAWDHDYEFAAPGSVLQAPKDECLYGPVGKHIFNPHDDEPRRCVNCGVPQAEPPKEEKL